MKGTGSQDLFCSLLSVFYFEVEFQLTSYFCTVIYPVLPFENAKFYMNRKHFHRLPLDALLVAGPACLPLNLAIQPVTTVTGIREPFKRVCVYVCMCAPLMCVYVSCM